MIQQFGAVFIYFQVMNDYGFRPSTLFYLDPEEGYFPKSTDVYNPNLPYNGNTNYGDENAKGKIEWLKTNSGGVDLRLFYVDRPATAWAKCRWTDGEENEGPRFYRYSEFTGKQICYTTEALKNAHTAYLCGIVCLQWADCVAAKTRSLSIAQQGFSNGWGNFGFISETLLVLIVAYVPFINIPLATRPLAFPHLGVPVFPWVTTLFLYDEMRKIYVRAGMKRKPTGQVILDGWVARNTYY